MSNLAIAGETERSRPLWLAALCGWLSAVALGWIMLLAYIEYDNRRLDEGHAFEADGAVRPPALLTVDWVGDAVTILGRLALIALAYALPLLLVIALLERGLPRTSRAWLLGGLAAVVPLILAWGALVALSGHPAPWSVYVVPALVLAFLGAMGGLVARRVRHRGLFS